MSEIIGNGKVSGLIAYLENLSAKGKVRSSVITPLKSATKAVFIVVDSEQWKDTDVRSVDIDDYINRFKNLTIGKYDSNSYNTYRARISRAFNWYNHFLQNPGWAPAIKERSQDTRKATAAASATLKNVSRSFGDISEGEVVPTPLGEAVEQISTSDSQNTSARLISFPFPMSNGVIATLYLPQSIPRKDAVRLQSFIKTLVIDEDTDYETS